jgi:hypothetical protein
VAHELRAIDATASARMKSLIRAFENHYLSDVRIMLTLPDLDHGRTARCNFVIIHALAADLGGIQ